MFRFYFTVLAGLMMPLAVAQKASDSIVPKELNEVIVLVSKKQLNEKQFKSLATVDEYLQGSNAVNLVRRGAYAWEPLIHNMSAERTLITIDGMRIFGACTDKMDPVTSYVEVSNLSEAALCSGQQGSCYGATLGGSLDLKRHSSDFKTKGWNFFLNNGFEANNSQKISGGSATYADSLYYADTDVMYREASNYTDGSGREILHSGFKKINISNTLGWKFTANQLIETSFIFDRATQVGYPALPMDVSLAQALIGSVKYALVFQDAWVKKFETKVYYNTITHRMDDTTRPEVPIHMDMPGWSNTGGFYAKAEAEKAAHKFGMNVSSFYNQSLAEMTMYPKNPQEKEMFMYTWPDVRTWYSGFFIQDSWLVNCHSELKLTASVGLHQNTIASNFGLSSLQIFYPEINRQKNRFLKSFGVQFHQNKNKFEWSISGGYSERAPSVSEGYGFYLFNSSDRYDYIGNPNLKTETALEFGGILGYKNQSINLKLNSNFFRINQYIIGVPNQNYIPMTIHAAGVKLYSTLSYADLFDLDALVEYKVIKNLLGKVELKYSSGRGSDGNNLPLISPFVYRLGLTWNHQKFSATIDALGNATQNHYGQTYGEHKTTDFAVFNLSTAYWLQLKSTKLLIKTGIENMADKYYSTYSDWNKIPRMGRNLFINITAHFL